MLHKVDLGAHCLTHRETMNQEYTVPNSSGFLPVFEESADPSFKPVVVASRNACGGIEAFTSLHGAELDGVAEIEHRWEGVGELKNA